MSFKATAESLRSYKVPEWFRDAKFGIFIHWGIYSIPAYGDEWYGRHMYLGTDYWAKSQGFDQGKETIQEHHVNTYGKEFGYKDFLDLWNPDQFDAKEWSILFEKSGARYVMPVGMHHDAFALYESALTPWNTVNKGIGSKEHGWKTTQGHGRDFILELQQEVKKQGMHYGISNHLAENCTWIPHLSEYHTDVKKGDEDPYQLRLLYGSDYTEQEEADRWLTWTDEMVDRYHPDLMYFDMALQSSKYDQVKREYAAHYYNDAMENNPDGVGFFYKGSAFTDGEAMLDIERGQLKEIKEMPWQTDTSISAKSWGYIEDDVYRNADYFIASLIDVVSKNGNLLLNIPPKADGSIPEEVQRIMLEIGEWLRRNGEAIYATRPYKIYGEGPTVPGSYYSDNDLEFNEKDIRFTTSKDQNYLYILSLTGIKSDSLLVHSLKDWKETGKFCLLETGEEIRAKQTEQGLVFDLKNVMKEIREKAFAIKVPLV